jgi:hypothetical protein
MFSVVLAVRVMKIGVDTCNVNKFTWMVFECDIDNSLKDTLDLSGDVLVATLSWSEAESTALGGSCWASTPTYWTDTVSFVRAVWVAKRATFDEFWWADHWHTIGDVSVIRVLGARDTNVVHASWAVR